MTNESKEINAPAELFKQQLEIEAKELGLIEEAKPTSEEVSVSKTETLDTNIEPQYSELELEQMEDGWKPKEQWVEEGGDPNDWVPAKQYKKVGEIIESKRKASKEVKELKERLEENTKLVKDLIDHNRQIEKATREATLREIEQRRLQAVEDGDRDAFLKAESDRLSVQQEMLVKPETVQQPAPVSPEVMEFQERHKSWLTSNDPVDQAMQAVVKERVSWYMQNDPNIDEKVAIQAIEERLKKAFPSKFGEPKPTVSKVGTSTISSSSTSSKYSLSRLDMEQKLTFEQIKKAEPSYKLEEYIDQLEKIGRLSK